MTEIKTNSPSSSHPWLLHTQGLFGTVVIGALLFQLPAARFPHHPGKNNRGPPLFILDRWRTQDPWTISKFESRIRRREIQVNNTQHQLQPCQTLLSFNDFWNSKKKRIYPDMRWFIFHIIFTLYAQFLWYSVILPRIRNTAVQMWGHSFNFFFLFTMLNEWI